MRCLKNALIQKFIDGETNSKESINIEKHSASCQECAQKIVLQKAFVYSIKKELNKLV